MKRSESSETLLTTKTKVSSALSAGLLAVMGTGCEVTKSTTDFGKRINFQVNLAMEQDNPNFRIEGFELRLLKFPTQESVEAAISDGVDKLENENWTFSYANTTQKELAQIKCATVAINGLAKPEIWHSIRVSYIKGREAEAASDNENTYENSPYYHEAASTCSELIAQAIESGQRLKVPVDKASG